MFSVQRIPQSNKLKQKSTETWEDIIMRWIFIQSTSSKYHVIKFIILWKSSRQVACLLFVLLFNSRRMGFANATIPSKLIVRFFLSIHSLRLLNPIEMHSHSCWGNLDYLYNVTTIISTITMDLLCWLNGNGFWDYSIQWGSLGFQCRQQVFILLSFWFFAVTWSFCLSLLYWFADG